MGSEYQWRSRRGGRRHASRKLERGYGQLDDEFSGHHFTHVITLCDRVREVCPEFPGPPTAAHWSISDPAADPAGRPAFDAVADELAERIGYLLPTITAASTLEAL